MSDFYLYIIDNQTITPPLGMFYKQGDLHIVMRFFHKKSRLLFKTSRIEL